jgi:DnaJ-class molecular chaperone
MVTGGNCPRCAGEGETEEDGICEVCGGSGEVDPDQLTIDG